MKGLQQYIDKHGRHFTEQLALAATSQRWSASDVMRSAQRKVYYNVTGATIGDMAYLTNMAYNEKGWPKTVCIDYCLSVIGDYTSGRESAFMMYISTLMTEGRDFDFTAYT